MSDYTIKVESLSKSYTIKHQQGERYTALRDVVSNGVKVMSNRLFRRASSHVDTSSEEFWALNNVSFEVKQGERIGIIGRNGAGKSTLLKILSRITEPTKGQVRIRGRVASLLEVGTGFHPELTGRENVYLNGAILGMSRNEIQHKFDEIVAFAEVERFLDTPVKRYSSGMYVRLAFAVAAHLEPEILIIDEVLAVGDIQFQKKSLGRMGKVASNGRTVLFVSHNMAAIKNLCSRCIVLSNGCVEFEGPPDEAIALYGKQFESIKKTISIEDSDDRTGTGEVQFADFYVENSRNERTTKVFTGGTYTLVFKIKVNNPGLKKIDIGFSFHTSQREALTNLVSSYQDRLLNDLDPGYHYVKCTLQDFSIGPGRLLVRGRITVNGTEADWPRYDLDFIDVEMGDYFGTSRLGQLGYAPFLIKGEWFLGAEKIEAYEEVFA